MTNVNISSLSLHSVYTKELAATGIIFRRHFRAGDLVSYFSGQRTLSDLMFHDNQTDADKAEVGAYYFNLGGNCAEWWGCRLDDFVIDIPREFRSFVKSVSSDHVMISDTIQYAVNICAGSARRWGTRPTTGS